MGELGQPRTLLEALVRQRQFRGMKPPISS